MHDVINDIYDAKIEDPKYQTLMRSIIKAWLQDAYNRGYEQGQKDFLSDVEVYMKRKVFPGKTIFVVD